MAKKKATTVIRLVSQAGTGYFYTVRKAVRANAEKCAFPSVTSLPRQRYACAGIAHVTPRCPSPVLA